MGLIGWIILGISLAIVGGAVIYLGISGLITYKSMKPKIDRLQATAERLQATQQTIQSEADKLKTTQENIKRDIDQKKEAIMFTVNEAKQTPQSIKQLGTALSSMYEQTKLKLPAPKQQKQTKTI
ncbi:septum formation initiator family protein [Bacillus sp. B190/17]|uniref:Septum formation initiator family protein n=1 Tax=Bacillus lumedeiriae TaxID=3058829 RepID=A0ABW8I9A0_9BACI